GAVAQPLQHAEIGHRWLALGVHDDDALPRLDLVLAQWRVNPHHLIGPVAVNDGVIMLADASLLELALQVLEHRRGAGDDQTAGGGPVQPVGQLQKLFFPALVGLHPAQGLDDADLQTGAHVDGDTLGFVDDEQLIVLVQDAVLQQLDEAGTWSRYRRLRGNPQRRHPYLVATVQAAVGLDPLLVHPHLAFADDAVDPGLGYALEAAEQEVVDALVMPRFPDLEQLHRMQLVSGVFLGDVGIVQGGHRLRQWRRSKLIITVMVEAGHYSRDRAGPERLSIGRGLQVWG